MSSKISQTHEEYGEYLAIWKKCRHTYDGDEKMKEQRETYLPRLTGQDDKEYSRYLNRGLFYNGVGRTVEGMEGMIFRKDMVSVYPTSMQSIADDFDMQGTSLDDYAKEIVHELTLVNRVGILVDYPRNSTVGLTIADIERIGIRPYASTYKAESILDWRYERVNNRTMLVMVKLKECVTIEGENRDQIRLLELTENGYQVSIYIEKDGEYPETPDDVFIPLMNNAPMRYLPFVFDRVIHKPVLLDLVNVNISHYRSTADYEHGLHFTGLPTAIFWGVQSDSETAITIGAETALAFSDPNGHAEYLEFTGQGLGALKEALADKKEMMASLGMKTLGAENTRAETATATSIKYATENSVLSTIAKRAGGMLTVAMIIMAEWQRVSGEIKITLNTDFTPEGITPQLFAELTKAYLAGTISYETYFANLQQGEVISADRDIEDERLSIQEGGQGLVA